MCRKYRRQHNRMCRVWRHRRAYPIPWIYHHRPNARDRHLLTNPATVRNRPYYRDRLRHLTLHYLSRACLLLTVS
jgi:hypothetical protein